MTHRGGVPLVPGPRRRRGGHGGLLGRDLHGGRLAQLAVGLQRGEVVDGGELNERREDEGEAHGDEPVHGGGVGHLGQRVARADAERGHGEHRGDAWGRRETETSRNNGGNGPKIKGYGFRVNNCIWRFY